jgi:hypothetical protein
MKNKLAKVNLRDVHALPALTTRERVDALRYEHSLGDFIKAAWQCGRSEGSEGVA